MALLIDRPDLGLCRGAVGAVVETFDDPTSLVGFSDDTGHAQAIAARRHRGRRVVSGAQG